MEQKLKKTAKQRGYGEKRADAYTYGTMRKTGWKPGRKSGDTDHSPKTVINHKS
jgi:hypothetical protein